MHDSFEFIENGVDMGRSRNLGSPGGVPRQECRWPHGGGSPPERGAVGHPINVASAQAGHPVPICRPADPHLQITWAPENHTTTRCGDLERAVAESTN
jgi:hypothetical protein